MKEKEAKTTTTLLLSLQSLGLIAIVVINKEGNEEKEDMEENPTFTSLNPFKDQKEVEQKEKDKMTTEIDDQVLI